MSARRLFIVLLLALASGSAQELKVAAASDLTAALAKLSSAFEKESGIRLNISLGSSGNFFAQIENGAPFDVFLSADVSFSRRLIDAGFAEQGSLTLYGVGRIVLWTMKPDFEVSRGLAVLADAGVRKVAIANPDHAPYGRAAKAALEHEKLWETLQPKLVLGENIAQTLEFVQTGNADAGVVALSLVLAPKLAGKGLYYEIPEAFHPPLEQSAVITKHGAENAGAKAFLQFLGSPEARPILERYGFRVPPGEAPAK